LKIFLKTNDSNSEDTFKGAMTNWREQIQTLRTSRNTPKPQTQQTFRIILFLVFLICIHIFIYSNDLSKTLNYRLGTANGTLISFDMFSAGVGRTGTFIALDILTEQGQTLGYVDPVGCVTELRNQRVSMVQTKVVLFSIHST